MTTTDRWEKDLCALLAAVKDPAEARELVRALLTPAERRDIAERWQIVKLLLGGSTQRRVRDCLSVSIATVTRGAREVNYGTGILQKFYRRLVRPSTVTTKAAA